MMGFGDLLKNLGSQILGMKPEDVVAQEADEKAQAKKKKEIMNELMKSKDTDTARRRANAWYGRGFFDEDEYQSVLEGIAKMQKDMEAEQISRQDEEQEIVGRALSGIPGQGESGIMNLLRVLLGQ